MKKLLIPSALALLAYGAQAQTTIIDVDGANLNNAGTASTGTIVEVSDFADNVAPSGTLVWTISDLDLDGIGGLNDTVAVQVSIFGSSTSGPNLRTRQGRISYGSDNNRVVLIGDQINFTDISVTDVSLNGATDAAWTSASSAVYTDFFLGGTQSNATEATIAGEVFEFPSGTNFTMSTPSSSALVELTNSLGNSATGRFRIDTLSYELTIVPEPSSYALLAGLLGLGYVMVRRRK